MLIGLKRHKLYQPAVDTGIGRVTNYVSINILNVKIYNIWVLKSTKRVMVGYNVSK